MELSVCPACNTSIGDHYHQYINMFGDTNAVWVVDDVVFRDPLLAVRHLEGIGFTPKEAMEYIRTLPKKYN
jgi:hypothetical protein